MQIYFQRNILSCCIAFTILAVGCSSDFPTEITVNEVTPAKGSPTIVEVDGEPWGIFNNVSPEGFLLTDSTSITISVLVADPDGWDDIVGGIITTSTIFNTGASATVSLSFILPKTDTPGILRTTIFGDPLFEEAGFPETYGGARTYWTIDVYDQQGNFDSDQILVWISNN